MSKEETKTQKGITLIALIITIIVMLILVGVSVTVALNGGLFSTAKQATDETQIALEKEQLLSTAIGAIGNNGEVDLNELDAYIVADGTFEGTGGIYRSKKTGNTYTVDEKGKIGEIESDLARYILGENLQGRDLMGADEEGNYIGILGMIEDESTFVFLDDPLTEDVDETQTLGVQYLTVATNEDSTKVFMYAKYDYKAYKIITDSTGKSEKLQLIYEPKGTEGQKTAEGWTILYDKGATAEAVSPTAMGTLRLGYAEGTTGSAMKLTEAIASYNGAIKKINDYCKTLEGLPTNSGVRSVGASTETTRENYTSTDLETWSSAYNGVGLKGDTNYEQDLVRMVYHGVVSTESEYLIASRYAGKLDDNHEILSVRVVTNTGELSNYHCFLYIEDSSDGAIGTYGVFAVRPIITIDNL